MRLKMRGLCVLVIALVIASITPQAEAISRTGTTDEDVLFGTNQHDVLAGRADDDFLFGKGGADTLRGETGDDTIFGGGGADTMDGGDGDDILIDDDSQGGDILRGRGGSDTLISLDGHIDQLQCGKGIDLAIADRNDVVSGCEEVLSGGMADEFILRGSNGNDSISGDDESEQIFGRGGNDTLDGDDGDDEIFGGGGTDKLRGGDDDDALIDDDSKRGDTIRSGSGEDVIFAADGAQTSIDCGLNGEGDTVFADRRDDVDDDCGDVFRG